MAKQTKKVQAEEPVKEVLEKNEEFKETKENVVNEKVQTEVETDIKEANEETTEETTSNVDEGTLEENNTETVSEEVENDTETTSEEVGNDTETASEGVGTEEPSTLSDEKILEIAEQIQKEGESLKEITEITPDTQEVLIDKINHLQEIEDKLKEDIERGEEELKENKATADKLFRRGFSEFWNGVSDGWNN